MQDDMELNNDFLLNNDMELDRNIFKSIDSDIDLEDLRTIDTIKDEDESPIKVGNIQGTDFSEEDYKRIRENSRKDESIKDMLIAVDTDLNTTHMDLLNQNQVGNDNYSTSIVEDIKTPAILILSDEKAPNTHIIYDNIMSPYIPEVDTNGFHLYMEITEGLVYTKQILADRKTVLKLARIKSMKDIVISGDGINFKQLNKRDLYCSPIPLNTDLP